MYDTLYLRLLYYSHVHRMAKNNSVDVIADLI